MGLDVLRVVSGVVHVDRRKVIDASLKKYNALVCSISNTYSQDGAVVLSDFQCVPS